MKKYSKFAIKSFWEIENSECDSMHLENLVLLLGQL